MATYRLRIGSRLPAWLSGASVLQWVEISNTALSSVPPTGPAGDYGDPAAKITTWCGAALKTSGSVYIVGMSGGHNDYIGNEVNVLPLGDDVPAWSEVVQRSAIGDMYTASPIGADLTGMSSHTYYSSQFINARNRFVVFQNGGFDAPGRASAPPGGWAYPLSGGFSPSVNFADYSWDAPNYIDPEGIGGSATAGMVCKHPTTEDVYISFPGFPGSGFWKWTQASNTWTQISSSGPNINYAGTAIDPTRNRILVVGDYNGTRAPFVIGLDGADITATFGGLGGDVLKYSNYPGLVYDSANDCFWAFLNTNPISVYRIRASDWYVDQPTLTGTAPATRSNGIQGSVQYAPELGGIAIANTYTGNVYFLRTS